MHNLSGLEHHFLYVYTFIHLMILIRCVVTLSGGRVGWFLIHSNVSHVVWVILIVELPFLDLDRGRDYPLPRFLL